MIETVENEQTFSGFHDALRQRCRMARKYRGGEMITDQDGKPILNTKGENQYYPETYTRPLPKTVKGKAALKAAKRERVRKMKAMA